MTNPDTFLDNLAMLLAWTMLISFVFLALCLFERILLYLVRRKLLNIKCLESKHYR